MKILLIICTAALLTSCHKDGPLLNAGPNTGKIYTNGDRTIIESPNTLHHPEDFIWGASVIKGDDGKYHMFYSQIKDFTGSEPVLAILASDDGIDRRIPETRQGYL